MKITELAKIVGCSRVHLYDVISQRVSPSLKLATKLEEATGINASRWLNDEPINLRVDIMRAEKPVVDAGARDGKAA